MMLRAYASRICAGHVQPADAARLCTYEENERTDVRITPKTESRPRVGNAHERWIETPTGLAKCPRCYPKESVA